MSTTSSLDVEDEAKVLQRVPHLALLSEQFYHEQMKPLLSEWLLLWLRKQGLRDITDEQTMRCLAQGAHDKHVQAALSDRHFEHTRT